MSFKQLSDEQKIIFLREFVAELVIHSAEDERLKKLIKVERIKRRLVKGPEEPIDHIGQSVIFNEQKEPPKKHFTRMIKVRPMKKVFVRNEMPKKATIMPIKKAPQKVTSKVPEPTDKIMEKINNILNDQGVQMVECPGAGRNILIKVRNKVTVSKLVLNEDEIKSVVTYFSDLARIPIVGGILKTFVNNLMISAVISDFAGSKFIITKKTPYDIIGGF